MHELLIMESTEVKFKGGGSIVILPPVFSSNGEYIFVSCRNSITCYHTKTAKVIKKFHGLPNVVGFSLHYLQDNEHVIACSRNGQIISWNVSTEHKALKMKLPLHDVYIEHFSLIPTVDEKTQLSNSTLVTFSSDNDTDISFGIYNLSSGKWKDTSLILSSNKYSVAVGGSVDPFFAVVEEHTLSFVKFKELKKIHRHMINKRKFTCIACHPEEDCVLTGDDTGRVLVWWNLTTSAVAQAVFHWHTLPVECVAFSMSGSQFYSGGGECVLVKWQFDNPHQKKFLPRRNAAIKYVVVCNDNLCMAVATADSTVQLLDARFELVSSIQHLILGTHFTAGILYDPRTKCLVLNSIVGYIQFYSPHDSTLLYNLDVVGQNKLIHERYCDIENTDVTKTAISKSGLWLATVEERKDRNSTLFESRLKFWMFNVEKQMYELNTSVELPHEKSVNSILFQPVNEEQGTKCITVGDDNKFKIWQLVTVDSMCSKSNVWNCVNVGFYRDLTCKALTFSCDGSLFAVAFGPICTVWSCDSCELRCSLLHPSNRDPLCSIKFGTSNQCHLLVTGTSKQLSVWNLLTFTMTWTVPLQVSLLVADQVSPYMAVVTNDKQLYIFSPSSSTPVYVKKRLVEDNKTVLTANFVPNLFSSKGSNWHDYSQFFFIDSNQELYAIGTKEDEQHEYSDFYSYKSDSISLFSSMQPKSKANPLQQITPFYSLSKNLTGQQGFKQFLDYPLHTMVPIRLTCGSILQSMVQEYQKPVKNS